MFVWKQLIKREAREKFAPFYEDEEAYEVMGRVNDACDRHLAETSLEYLANRAEFKLFPVNLTLDPSPELLADCNRLKELFLRDFVLHNEARKDSLPTKNELVFMVLAKAWYTITARTLDRAEREANLRVDSPEDSIRPLLDARIRLAEAMSVHAHVVNGQPYETREAKAKRRRDNRLDRLCPTDHTLAEWQAMRQQQEAEDNLEAQRELLEKQLIESRLARKRAAPGTVEPPPPTQRWRPAPLFPDVDALMEDMSFFLTCYYVDGTDTLRDALEAHPDAAPTNLDVRDALTNQSSGGALGLLWQDDPRIIASSFVVMATQFFARAWSEQFWRVRYPNVREVRVNTASFSAYVIERVDNQELQEDHIKEFTANCYELLLPIGGRGLATRTYGTNGGNTRRLMYAMHGVSVVAEIDELFDIEASRRLIAYDEGHPLYDALSMMLVQFTCYGQTNDGFSMVAQCTIPTSGLMRQGKALEATGPTQHPWIVHLCGEWLVHDRGEWWRPSTNRFGAAWLVFLALLKQRYKFQLDVSSDLSYWEGIVRLPILQP